MTKISRKSKIQEIYTAIIEKDPKSGYYAYVPSLPGCYSQGETYEEAVFNIKEATQLYLEVAQEDKVKKQVPVTSIVQFSFA